MGSGAGFGGDLKFPADELLSSREDVDDARGKDDFAGFNSDEGNQSERDGFVKVAEEDGEPCDSAGEDDGVRGENGEERGWEFPCHSPVREESGEECGGEEADEEAGGGSGEVGGSGGGAGEDGDSGGALGEVEDDGGDGGFASGERGEDEEGEGLEGCGDGEVGDLDFGGERQRQRAANGEDDGAEERGRGLGEGLGGLHGGVGGGWRVGFSGMAHFTRLRGKRKKSEVPRVEYFESAHALEMANVSGGEHKSAREGGCGDNGVSALHFLFPRQREPCFGDGDIHWQDAAGVDGFHLVRQPRGKQRPPRRAQGKVRDAAMNFRDDDGTDVNRLGRARHPSDDFFVRARLRLLRYHIGVRQKGAHNFPSGKLASNSTDGSPFRSRSALSPRSGESRMISASDFSPGLKGGAFAFHFFASAIASE